MRAIPFLFLFLLGGCGSDSTAKAPPHGDMPASPAGVASPIIRDLPVVRELTGRIEAVEYVELRPRVGGLIEKVIASDGAMVTPGQVIMEIDDKLLRTQLARAEAEIARSEARLAQTQRDAERSQKLVADKVVSQQIFDDAESARLAAAADVAAARAALSSVKLDLDYAKVTSPIAGRLGKIMVTAGNLVQGGGPVPATLLATIVSVDPVDAVFDLDEATWRKLGESLRGMQGGGAVMPVNVGIAGEDGYPHPGVVRFVDNHVDSASGSIRIHARIANPHGLLTPGAFARVQLQIEPPKPTMLVNERAVLTQLATRYVIMVGEDGSTSARTVRLGDAVGPLRMVVDGLKADERMVVSGAPITKLGLVFQLGQKVAPVPASMDTLEPLAVAGEAKPEAAPAGNAP